MAELDIKPLTLNFGPQHPAAHGSCGCELRRLARSNGPIQTLMLALDLAETGFGR